MPKPSRAASLKALTNAETAISAEVRGLEGDPAAQARAVTELLGALRLLQDRVAELRHEPVRQLRGQGASLEVIADAIGVSKTAVAQVVRDYEGRPRWKPRTRRGLSGT